MAWGRRKKENEIPTQNTTQHAGSVVSNATIILGPALVITGTVHVEQELLLFGKVFGPITSTSLVHVGPSGEIEGDVTCDRILIEGKVRGNITASGTLTIESTGSLIGDTLTREFVNRPGGFFQGYSQMSVDANGLSMIPQKKKAHTKQHDKAHVKQHDKEGSKTT